MLCVFRFSFKNFSFSVTSFIIIKIFQIWKIDFFLFGLGEKDVWCDLKRWSAENSQQTDCATENSIKMCDPLEKSTWGARIIKQISRPSWSIPSGHTHRAHACCVPPGDTLSGTCAIYTWSYPSNINISPRYWGNIRSLGWSWDLGK